MHDFFFFFFLLANWYTVNFVLQLNINLCIFSLCFSFFSSLSLILYSFLSRFHFNSFSIAGCASTLLPLLKKPTMSYRFFYKCHQYLFYYSFVSLVFSDCKRSQKRNKPNNFKRRLYQRETVMCFCNSIWRTLTIDKMGLLCAQTSMLNLNCDEINTRFVYFFPDNITPPLLTLISQLL